MQTYHSPTTVNLRYNVAPVATKPDSSSLGLLRAYLEAVTLSEEIQTRLWQAAELTLAQVRVLRRLANEPRPLGQLGQELGLAPPSVTRLVDRLEERQLLERSRGGKDRRKVMASLTAEGRRLVTGVPPIFDATAIRTAVDGMSPDDRERIAAALREFNAAVRRAEETLTLIGAQQ